MATTQNTTTPTTPAARTRAVRAALAAAGIAAQVNTLRGTKLSTNVQPLDGSTTAQLAAALTGLGWGEVAKMTGWVSIH